jgi:hypothetical protein
MSMGKFALQAVKFQGFAGFGSDALHHYPGFKVSEALCPKTLKL